jgi:hypothetical protein
MSESGLDIIPGSAQDFMYVVSAMEIAAGLAVFVAPRIGGFLVAAWLTPEHERRPMVTASAATIYCPCRVRSSSSQEKPRLAGLLLERTTGFEPATLSLGS